MVTVSSGPALVQGGGDRQVSSRSSAKEGDASSKGHSGKSDAQSSDFSSLLQHSSLEHASSTTSAENEAMQKNAAGLTQAESLKTHAKTTDAKNSNSKERQKDELKRQHIADISQSLSTIPQAMAAIVTSSTPALVSANSLTNPGSSSDDKLTSSTSVTSSAKKMANPGNDRLLQETSAGLLHTSGQSSSVIPGIATIDKLSANSVNQLKPLGKDSAHSASGDVVSSSAEQTPSSAHLQALVHSVLQQGLSTEQASRKQDSGATNTTLTAAANAAPSQGAVMAGLAHSTPSLSASPMDTSIQTPVQSPDFGQALGQHLVMMVGQKVSSARIHVTPQEMGPIAVEIRMQGQGQVNVSMLVSHSTTHQALQQALPHLHDLFQAQGMNMQASLTGGQGQGQGGQQAPTREEWLMNTQAGPGAVSVTVPPSLTQTAQRIDRAGALDLYA